METCPPYSVKPAPTEIPDGPPTRGPLGERLTAAEMLPIRVHLERGSWQVDYGSYVQGSHPTFREAIKEASAAALVERRALTVEYGYAGFPAACDPATGPASHPPVDDLASKPPTVKSPHFVIGEPFTVVSVTPHDASSIVDRLAEQTRREATTALAKIRRATHPAAETAEVELGFEEQAALIAAIDSLRAHRGMLGQSLIRLENAVYARIEQSRLTVAAASRA